MRVEARTTGERLERDARELAAGALRLADERGRAGVARLLGAALEPRADAGATVVVVGETKRGKSAFVNALVGADVTPTHTDVTTNAYIIVRHAERPMALLHRGGRSAEEIPLESVREWATVAGNPGNVKGVRAVEVGVDHPLLRRGLKVVDTPGVGGLDAAHRQVTLAALSRADALVFVTDPDAPLSRPEHEFLRDATRRISAVVFVLTKIDDYPHWNAILRDDRSLIAQHSPEFAESPFFGVSNVDKREADASGDGELWADSGFEAVERALEEGVIARCAALRLGNLVKASSIAIDELDRRERPALTGGAPDESLREALEQARKRQQAFAQRTEGWGAKMGVDFQRRVRNRFEPAFKRAVAEMVRNWDERVRAGDAELARLPDDLEAELQAIALDMDGLLADSAAQLATALGELFELGVDDLLEAAERDGEALLDLPPLPAAGPVGRKPGRSALGGAAAIAAGALAGGKYALLFGPQGLVLGAGAGALLGGLTWTGSERLNRQVTGQQAALQVVQAAAASARIDLDAYLRERLLDIQAALHDALRELIIQRRAELTHAVQEQERRLTSDKAERTAARNRAIARLRETEPLRARVAVLEEQVR